MYTPKYHDFLIFTFKFMFENVYTAPILFIRYSVVGVESKRFCTHTHRLTLTSIYPLQPLDHKTHS